MIDSHERRDPKECPRCHMPVPSGAAECPACATGGNGSSPDSAGDGALPESGSSVYALLSASNLARMRGQWDEAVEKCVEALRLEPNSPTAHSLIGDIYQDQGRREEAIQWYEMALELDPGNDADRTKLERLLHPEITTSVPVRPSPWIRIGIPAALILAFLMMVVGIGTFLTSKQRDAAPVDTDGEPPPIEIPPALRPPEGRQIPSRVVPRAAPSAVPSVGVESAREGKLRQNLTFRPAADRSYVRVANVQIDPGVEAATVSLLYHPKGGLQPETLLQWAADAASQAYRIDGYIQSCKVRVLSPTMGGAAPDLALIAGSGRNQALAATSPDGVFTSVWWNPEFFPNSPIPPSTPSSGGAAPASTGGNGASAAGTGGPPGGDGTPGALPSSVSPTPDNAPPSLHRVTPDRTASRANPTGVFTGFLR